jgi:Arc/MetJ-type ribon-helix-helix transcriptional regulator
MKPARDATEREPLEIVLSTRQRIALGAELTTRIWEAVERGEYSSPEGYINHTLQKYFDSLKDSVAKIENVREIRL